jgi:hypothetical protein
VLGKFLDICRRVRKTNKTRSLPSSLYLFGEMSSGLDIFGLAAQVFDSTTHGEGKNYVLLAQDARRGRDKLIANLMNHVSHSFHPSIHPPPFVYTSRSLFLVFFFPWSVIF